MTNGLMAGKRGLIMGLANDKSIAWGIAKGGGGSGGRAWHFPIRAKRFLKRVGPLAERLGSDTVLPCDVSDMESVDALFAALNEKWGKLDFVVHAIGFSDKNRASWSGTSTPRRDNFHDVDGHFGLFLHR